MKTAVTAFAALLLLSACGGAEESDPVADDSVATNEEPTAAEEEEEGEPAQEDEDPDDLGYGAESLEGAPIGEPAVYAEEGMVDGDGSPADTSYEIVVDDVETLDAIEYDDGYDVITHEPQGQWVVVSYSAANVGDRPGSPSGSTSELWTTDGSTHEDDFDAGYDLGLERDRNVDRLNPGQEGEGLLVFDIPADTEPELLMFRGSFEQVPAVFDLT